MARQILNDNSLAPNDKLGDTPWAYTAKLNSMTQELYDRPIVSSPENQIMINSFSDFPEPMLSDKQYYIGSDIVIPTALPTSWLNLPKNIEFLGSAAASSISWDGSASLFNGVDMGRFAIKNVILNTPNGTLYNISDVSGFTIVNLITASIGVCKEVGNINVFGLVIDTCNYASVDQGMTTGAKSVVLSVSLVGVTSTNPSFVHIDISTSTLSTLEFTNNRVDAPVGAVAFKGLPNSVNVSASQVGSISSCEILGGAVALSGLTDDDVGYDYKDVTGVIDSAPIGHCYIGIGDERVTSITSGVEVPVAGVYTQGSESSQSTSSSDGVITMLNRIEKRGNVTISMDVVKTGGGSDSYLFKVKKIPIATGIAIDVEGAFTTKIMSGGGSDSFSISSPVRHIAGDKFYASVESLGTNDDITANTQGFEVIN